MIHHVIRLHAGLLSKTLCGGEEDSVVVSRQGFVPSNARLVVYFVVSVGAHCGSTHIAMEVFSHTVSRRMQKQNHIAEFLCTHRTRLHCFDAPLSSPSCLFVVRLLISQFSVSLFFYLDVSASLQLLRSPPFKYSALIFETSLHSMDNHSPNTLQTR